MFYWSKNNPRWMNDTRWSQNKSKVNIWAGILNNTIIGPFFIDGNLDGETYLTMLRDNIVPAIQAIVGNDFDEIWFQQDGAGPHYSLIAREYLDETFPARWIGRRGEIEWPARSPDLTPLDYFLLGYLKDRVYQTKPNNIEELKQKIRDEIAAIEPDMIQRAVSHFYLHISSYQEVEGRQFEHKFN